MPACHHRHSIRLQGYDYSQAGGYFVTIATFWRECLFGEILDDTMQVNALGSIVQECWDDVPIHLPNVDTDAFVVMPNHVHGILFIHENDGRTATSPSAVGATHASPVPKNNIRPRGPSSRSLGAIIGSFKSSVTRRAGGEFNTANIWQRNYYEHIIHHQAEYERIAGYILSNPANWAADEDHPMNAAGKYNKHRQRR